MQDINQISKANTFQVESFCPIMDNRKFVKRRRKAQINRELKGLLDLLPEYKNHLVSNTFMRARLKRIWPDWLEGIQHYINGVNFSWPDSLDHCKHCSSDDMTCFNLCQSTKITGQPFLYGRPKLNSATRAWIRFEKYDLSIQNVYGQPGHEFAHHIPCMVKSNEYDLVYTDITGFRQLDITQIRTPLCKFRILDTFGTEAPYNRKAERWGGLHLNLQQFYTFFPHSPDNTFLGFVTEISPFKSKSNQSLSKPIALIYGKQSYMWNNKTNYLRILSDYFELHGNVMDNVDKLPKFVHIHQMQYGQPYLELMSKAQILIGLGFPYEGPAPLEAIANGLIFLNPHFDPPHGRSNQAFFSDKPTSRGVSAIF
ncbi:unnamed protein product [Schistosoma mattheei]|uniref:alpha-1,6-mannosyl-glycoprotein 6-beta-N-acetylglucosaminyltransferase n=1 Tax=Schistosoma mattheei TaxID=31246 RepID=A0A183P6E4_9TREM|nr:unnamed protein product [Schistosoma mattheei]